MLGIFSRFYGFLFKYKWRFGLFLLCLLLANLAYGSQPYFYKLFVASIKSGSSFEYLLKLMAIYFGVRALDLFFSMGMYYFMDNCAIYAARDARFAVVKKIQELDFAYHLTKSTGSLISAIKRGDGAFFGMSHAINIQLAGVVLQFLIMVSFFANLRLEIAGIMVISFTVALATAKLLIANNIKKRLAFNDAEDVVSGIIVDNMINYETVKLFGKEEREQARLNSAFKPWVGAFWGYGNSFRKIDFTIGTIGNISLFAVLLFSLVQVSHINLSLEDYVLVLGFVTSFYPRFFEMIYEFRNVAKQYADIEIYFSVFDLEPQVKDPEKPVLKNKVRGEIDFKNITFLYPGTKAPALKNFSLSVRQGESVAFVGRSGVGKTTLVKLLMRFYDVQRGEITIDNIDIRDFTKSQLRRFIGVVPQETVLFNDTIRFNIAYGSRDIDPSIPAGRSGRANQKTIDAAARMAHLDEFIAHLPKKYETMVGERGVKLSGGQKQRLAIARMILADPDIVVFDEATSQLDSESEKAIQDAFWKARENKTTIIIAHRLSTVVRADKIVVMEKGKIVEMGSHRALISKKGGLYRKFWELQIDAFDENTS